jgi:hypothetical protein
MKWFAHRNLVRLAVELLLVDESHGRRAFGNRTDLTLTTEEPGDEAFAREPTLSLPYDAAQTLLQALWDEGFRPNNDEGSAGHVAALQAHVKFAERVTDRLLPGESSRDEVFPP